MEVWGGLNETGYPFSYVSTIARGIVGIDAIAGHQDGFGKGIFFIGDDYKVSTLDGYTTVPISVPDLDLKIEAEPDKTVLTVSVYVSQGHGVVVVQGPNWCWEYDTTLQNWRLLAWQVSGCGLRNLDQRRQKERQPRRDRWPDQDRIR
jgi:hypothetical protein